ncbi:MAG TPA: MFS transporter [Bacillota bacterium]|nr:MFS transporter [Bacillota bacterium]
MKYKQTTIDQTERKNITYWIIFIGIILVGSTLRAPLTSVGSLISLIREDLQISHTLAGMITTLPLLAFAFLSPIAPRISRRIGMERTIFFSLLLLLIGIVVRSLFGVSFLFIGTLFIGLAIAFGNVLIPVIIQLNFPLRVGVVMGLYAVFMNIAGATASGVSVPISSIQGVGWRGSLAFWGILVLIAILVWLPHLKKQKEQPNHKINNKSAKGDGSRVWRSPLAWYITLFMGLQSLMFYTLITWLPDILQLHGYSPSSAGWMLFLMQAFLIPVTFIVPIYAERMKEQRFLGGIVASMFILGILGVLSGYTVVIPIAIIILGMACGAAFSLCMMLFSLRTKNSEQAAEISGMAQSFGYLLAAIGPTLFGAIHDITDGWQWPLMMLLVIAGIIFLVAVASGKDRVIELNN